jgi:hypothetical protein
MLSKPIAQSHLLQVLQHLSLCLLLQASICPAQSGIPSPIQVPRYDDADDYLPAAQARNKDKIRLLLPQQPGEELFKVPTPRNVTVDVIAFLPNDADAAVVLLVGGTSVHSIVNDKLDRSFSFRPRSRDHWWANRFATFLVDAPSDRLGKDGIQDLRWRAGPEHQADLKAVLDAIGRRFPGKLVIQGHSNGAVSSAAIAGLNDPRVGAYAYSSPAHVRTGTNILPEVAHGAPVILLQHRRDTCPASKASDAGEFLRWIRTPAARVLWIDGGVEPMSGPCGPFGAHSFVGVEKQAVDALAAELRKLLQ